MNRIKPSWLSQTLFPFESKWVSVGGNEIHYIDEGRGETILFVHGTPEWSFGFREVIKHLKQNFRCVAIDLLGFGLSDKPANASYTCQSHASRLETFINTLQLKNFSLVANDFGGGISMSYVLDHPENVNAIILFNTWMRSLKNDKHYATPAKLMNTWFGKRLYLDFNFPVNVIMPSAYGNRKYLTRQVHEHYRNALKKNGRHAAYAFVKELMDASDWWQNLWNKVDTISEKPFLFFWGLKDKFIPPSELEKWRTRLPSASIVTFPDAGHFVQEEKPNEMALGIEGFITSSTRYVKVNDASAD